jgi:predicted PurR-regulated permease PerM
MSDEEVKATVFGTPVAIKGIAALVVVVLAAALGGLIYLLLTVNASEHRQQSIQQMQEHQAFVETLKEINHTNEKIQDAVDENSYMVLADEKERQAIKAKLGRPSSLSRKLRAETE